MYSQINSIKSAAKAEAVFNSLYGLLVQRVGEKQAAHEDRMTQRASPFKPNGLAWWKDRCRAAAHSLVAADANVSHFIAASPETEAWGGFLGGERIHYVDRKAEAVAMDMITARIARA